MLSLLGGSLSLGAFVITSGTAALALAGSVLGLACALFGPRGWCVVFYEWFDTRVVVRFRHIFKDITVGLLRRAT